jgi:excisionase family DNA binding protein
MTTNFNELTINGMIPKSSANNQPELFVPIHEKMLLTIKEAAEYSNIGINKIDSMLRSPGCAFVLFVGTKKLVKRKAFEEYIGGKLVI